MSEPREPETREAPPFDPRDPQAWRTQLHLLPLRATVAFAVRCAKRVQPLVRLARLKAEAYCAGLDLRNFQWSDARSVVAAAADTASAVAAEAAASAAAHLRDAALVAAADAAHAARESAASAAASAFDSIPDATEALLDLMRLLRLKLGGPNEPGEPIRWNDPRLGPLWADGPPEWHVKAGQACRELEEQLRTLPNPNAPPDDPALLAQAAEYLKAEQWYCEGKFNAYRGEYVFFSDGVIYGHGRNLADLRPLAEEKAAAVGIPPERLVDYFVPGE
jgi:hypothetical protein